MPDIDFFAGLWKAVRPTVVAFLLLAAAAGALLALLYWRRRKELRARLELGFWGPQRRRAVPWTFADLLLLLFLFFGSEVIVAGMCRQIGTALALDSPPAQELAAIAAAAPVGPFAPPTPGLAEGSLARAELWLKKKEELSQMRWMLLGLLICRVAAAVFAIAYLRRRAGAAPYHLLLTAHDWPLNLWRGYLVWFAITLPLFFLYVLLLLLSSVVGERTPHTVEKFLALQPALGDRFVVLLLTVAVSPFIEELLLRGVMQPLFIEEPLLADTTILMSLLMAIGYGLSGSLNDGWAWGPVVFLGLVGPGYLLFEWLTRWLLPRPGAARGIFATALVFALMHHTVWPTPVPIFLLGLALGWLAYRTQSLVGCVLLHSLFNAVSMLADVASR